MEDDVRPPPPKLVFKWYHNVESDDEMPSYAIP